MPATSQKNLAISGAAADLQLSPDVERQLIDQQNEDVKRKKIAQAAASGLLGMGSDGYGAASVLGY